MGDGARFVHGRKQSLLIKVRMAITTLFLGRSRPDKDEPNWQKYLQTQPKKDFKSAVLSLDLLACGQQVAHSAVL